MKKKKCASQIEMLYPGFFSLLSLADSPVFTSLSCGLELPTSPQFCPPSALITSLLQIALNSIISILIIFGLELT